MKPTERILFADVETFPVLMYAWQIWEANALRVVENTSICSWSVKWYGGKQTTRCLADYKGYKPNSRDDRRLMEELYPILEKAEVVVGHNGDKFDIKKINYRFMVHGMTPPRPYAQVDTLKEVRKISSFDSNRLNDLAKLLTQDEKMRTGGADLWFDCLEGDLSAWKHMKEYNAKDVRLLEDVYLKIRPWMKQHPNLATAYGPDMCPRCGSAQIKKDGVHYAKTTAYQMYECSVCGKYIRGTENVIKKEDKPYVTI